MKPYRLRLVTDGSVWPRTRHATRQAAEQAADRQLEAATWHTAVVNIDYRHARHGWQPVSVGARR